MSSGNGIVVDELVSVIKFEMDAHSKKILEDADKASKKGTANINAQSKAMKMATGVTSTLTDHIKSLGIVSGVTSGIMAAWSVNAGKEAARLTSLSQATQVNIKDLQQLGSVYEQVGGDAKNFASDATAFFNTYGKKLDVSAMKDLAKTFSTMAPDMAQHMGRAYGFSDDMIRILRKGPDAIQEMTVKAERLGHVVKEEDIESLNAMNTSWEQLGGTIKATSLMFQSGMSPAMKEGFDQLTEAIARNQDAFKVAGEELGNYLGTATKMMANFMDGDFSWGSYVGTARNNKKSREAIATESAKPMIQVETERVMAERGISEKFARERATKTLSMQTRLSQNQNDKEAHDELYVRPSEKRLEHYSKLTKNLPFLQSLGNSNAEIDSILKNQNLSFSERQNSVAYILAEDEAKRNLTAKRKSQIVPKSLNDWNAVDSSVTLADKNGAFIASRHPEIRSEDYLPNREFIPTPAVSNGVTGGDYANNSGNTSTTQNINLTVNQQITAPDAVSAGEMSIAEMQKATYAGGFNYWANP